jgi:hypothetical protein
VLRARFGSGRQLNEVDNVSHTRHAADAFPANLLGVAGRCLAANGRDPVVGVNFGERQAGNVSGFYEFENSVFDAFV